MRVLVDTSVWIDFFNDFSSRQARTLAELLADEHEIATCGVVLAEFFQGIHGAKGRRKLESYFLDMSYFTPTEPQSYLDAAQLFRSLRSRGETVRSTIDCLVAVLAAENDTYLLARDRDFDVILASGLCPARPAPLVD